MPTPEEIEAIKAAEEAKKIKEEGEAKATKKETEHAKDISRYTQEAQDYILALREENGAKRIANRELNAKLEKIENKEKEKEENKKIEDGKLTEVLSQYKLENETLKSENDKFHTMLDKKIEISLETLSDSQKGFYEGLNYFQKLEYLDSIAGVTTPIDPDKKRQTGVSLDSQHETLMEKYSKTGDESFLIEASVIEKEILKSKNI